MLVRHAFANRMLFGLVVCVVMSLPFVFHWWGLGASDPGTQGGDGASLVAAALVDPYVQAANDQALAEGRATTLADVVASLPAPTSAGSTAAAPDPAESGVSVAAPTFTVSADRITAQVTTSGSPVTCVITISAGKAVDRC
jgi:hypothetical protein